MIVVDSSALVAVCFNEADRDIFTDAILGSDDAKMSAPNLVEACMAVEARNGEAGGRELDRIVASFGLSVIAFDADHVEAARQAFRRYGKGRHRAALNFGDCCAYALAKTLDLPLLFKGNDFALTDIKRAL
ncbi:MAG: type II toxin-antitoxin system VapC family toxin [Reyranella sp.]|uniref:type II toxin-antitoxin system VapC family toxin n=1 Tax=Reyranella sp. TaxID=1929291 RepID=UPI0025E00A3D|nr:type II toxin-antitoxin system VapC family toxin [Reyranella sp.]MBR2816490.1 type II toxin-antitoxin system VapC family toxin [Reyranella sp.]